MDDAERLKRGEAARRRVLGDEWVDRSAKNRNAFNAEWFDYHHPQPRGAMSGPGRISTTAPGASW